METDVTKENNIISNTTKEKTDSEDISSEETKEDTIQENENSAEKYRVTPPPQIFWGEEYDPTKDPD